MKPTGRGRGDDALRTRCPILDLPLGTTTALKSLHGTPFTIIRSNFATWTELDEADRSMVRERIADGVLPADFRVTQHRYYIDLIYAGGRKQALELVQKPSTPVRAGYGTSATAGSRLKAIGIGREPDVTERPSRADLTVPALAIMRCLGGEGRLG